MLFDLIGKDWQQLVYASERLQQTIDRERKALEEYAQGDNPNPRYVAKMNALFLTISNYMAASETVIDGMITAREIVGDSYEEQRNNYRVKELQEENNKLKLYLKSLGKDPDLVQYMQVRDFYY